MITREWRVHVAPIPMQCSECDGAIGVGEEFWVRWAHGPGWAQSDGDEAVCGDCVAETDLYEDGVCGEDCFSG